MIVCRKLKKSDKEVHDHVSPKVEKLLSTVFQRISTATSKIDQNPFQTLYSIFSGDKTTKNRIWM